MTLDDFTACYITCALWSSTDELGNPLDSTYDVDDIAPETMTQMIEDCADFQKSFADLIREAIADHDYSSEQAGHDFWLTRNRHGAGFWDRGLGKLGDKLTAMAHAYGSCDLYIGDDGKVWCEPMNWRT